MDFNNYFKHFWRTYLNAKSSTYCFDVKIKIPADFHICVSGPLNVVQYQAAS